MLNRPDASKYTDDVEQFRRICERTGLSTREIARRIGINDGALRGYLAGRASWPYPVQFAIEQLDGAQAEQQRWLGGRFIGAD